MQNIIAWFRKNYPELLESMKNSEHGISPTESNPYHIEGDVWTHTMMVCLEAERDGADIINKVSAILHDIGKPSSREIIRSGEKKPDPNGVNSWKKEESEKDKVSFRGHEGVSFFMAVGILEKMVQDGIIKFFQMEEILKIISLHGVLFNYVKDGKEYKPENIVNIFDTLEQYERFIKQVKYDHFGRFHEKGDALRKLGKEIYNSQTYKEHKKAKEVGTKDSGTVIIACGLPASGKSTIYKNLIGDWKLISRDEIVQEKADEMGLTYSEAFNKLSKKEHKEIDEELMKRYIEALKTGDNIYVDLTNTSKKARKKFIAPAKQKGYTVTSYVVICPLEEIYKRNEIRGKEGKYIPKEVYLNMCKSFLYPTKVEGFDEIYLVKGY